VTTTVQEPQPKAKLSQSRKKRLIISLGDKGGVGKSFLIRKIAELHMESSTPNLLLVDGDASVSSIFKFHQNNVVPFNLHGSVDARDMFVNDLLRRGSDVVIADMPAASLSTLREMATEYNFADEVIRAGYRMTIVSPITPYDDPLLDFQEAVNLVEITGTRGAAESEVARGLRGDRQYDLLG
jgi:Mrp family chromosome partitioning ATPase